MSSPCLYRPLPVRVALGDGEALDSFLERLALSNDLLPSQMHYLLTAPTRGHQPLLAFLMVKPDPEVVGRIRILSGLETNEIEQSTLVRFDGALPLRLDKLDVRQRRSFRQVVTQGWFPRFGTQVCPRCLALDGRWRVAWRLPIVAVCLEHAVFLTPRCSSCGKRFRSLRYSPLRPRLGSEQPCGNPLGLRNPCPHSVLAHACEPAPTPVIATARSIQDAMAGRPTTMLGNPVDPREYLAELRHLATLLIHLLSRPVTPPFVVWAGELPDEAAQRATNSRGPRWGISPPQSAVLRGNVLAEAQDILAQTSVAAAAARLEPWLELIATEPNGPTTWLVNRTTRTATMDSLIHATTERRQHVGRRLDKMRDSRLPPTAIPQLLDQDLYLEAFDGMLGGNTWTGQLYASLCVVRAVAPVNSWSAAATIIGLDAEVGVRTARAASARLRVRPQRFAAAVERVVDALPRRRDFRQRESRVRALAGGPVSWYEQWRTAQSPVRRLGSLPYAITWMWCEVAQGSLDTSPAWDSAPTRQRKATYRVFRDRLPPSAQDSLRHLVLQGWLADSGGVFIER